MGRYIAGLLFLLALSFAGCGDEGFVSTTSDSVVGGTADHNRTPAVVGLLINDGEALCSGALIAPRWVLTARHCVSVTDASVDCASGVGRVYSNRPAEALSVRSGDDVHTGVELARGDLLVVPPARVLCNQDIALIHLDRAVNVAPLALSASEISRGDTVRVVGFGRRGDTSRAGLGRRYRRESVAVVDTTAREFTVAEGPCSGDSGSPAIDPRTGAITGVLSRGTSVCRGGSAYGVYTRVGPFAPWIREALRAAR